MMMCENESVSGKTGKTGKSERGVVCRGGGFERVRERQSVRECGLD